MSVSDSDEEVVAGPTHRSSISARLRRTRAASAVMTDVFNVMEEGEQDALRQSLDTERTDPQGDTAGLIQTLGNLQAAVTALRSLQQVLVDRLDHVQNGGDFEPGDTTLTDAMDFRRDLMATLRRNREQLEAHRERHEREALLKAGLPAPETLIASLQRRVVGRIDDGNKAGKTAAEVVLGYSKTEEFQCVICQEDAVAGTELVVLDCSHEFCTQCITTWLRRHATCPTCRWRLPVPHGRVSVDASVSTQDRVESVVVAENDATTWTNTNVTSAGQQRNSSSSTSSSRESTPPPVPPRSLRPTDTTQSNRDVEEEGSSDGGHQDDAARDMASSRAESEQASTGDSDDDVSSHSGNTAAGDEEESTAQASASNDTQAATPPTVESPMTTLDRYRVEHRQQNEAVMREIVENARRRESTASATSSASGEVQHGPVVRGPPAVAMRRRSSSGLNPSVLLSTTIPDLGRDARQASSGAVSTQPMVAQQASAQPTMNSETGETGALERGSQVIPGNMPPPRQRASLATAGPSHVAGTADGAPTPPRRGVSHRHNLQRRTSLMSNN